MTSKGTVAVLSALAAFGAAVVLQPGTAAAQKTFHIKIGMATVADPQYEMGVRVGEELKKRSDGRLTFQVFPGSQLGIIPRQIEGLQLGTVEMFLTPPGFLTGLNPAFQVLDAPGLFESIAHGHKALTNPIFHDKFLALAESKGVLGTNVWLYGGQVYATHEPLLTPEGLKGRKIRVLATPMERAIPAVFGATGVPIPYSEVVPALQKKVVDGARTSLVVMAASKFFTVVKNVTITDGGYIPTGTWVSKAWFNRLPADLQKLVMTVPRELEDWGSKNANDRLKAAEQEWRDNGATIRRFSDADQKRYMDAIKEVGVKHLGGHKNAQVREMYELLKKAVAMASTN